MLIAISGSQGSGKSTTLNALKDKGYKTIERKTSRSILTDWDVTLQQVNNDPELTTKFQDEITKRKFEDEIKAAKSNEIWFTERTHTDLFTYALVSLGKDNKYSDWLNNYHNVCKEYNKIYSKVFYLTAGHFSIEHDGVRGSNDHYSKMVDLVMLDFTNEMVDNSVLKIINASDLNQRIENIVWGITGL